MPTWLKLSGLVFGLLFFLYHLGLATWGFRSALSRDQRLEAVGAIVPGLSGLLMVAAAWSPWPALGIGLAVVGVPILILGRAIYELIIFAHRQGHRRRAGKNGVDEV